MKREYIQPAIKVIAVKPASIVCASVSFGTGTTSSMDAKDWDYDW